MTYPLYKEIKSGSSSGDFNRSPTFPIYHESIFIIRYRDKNNKDVYMKLDYDTLSLLFSLYGIRTSNPYLCKLYRFSIPEKKKITVRVEEDSPIKFYPIFSDEDLYGEESTVLFYPIFSDKDLYGDLLIGSTYYIPYNYIIIFSLILSIILNIIQFSI